MDIADFTPQHACADLQYDSPEMTLAIRRIICRCCDAEGWREKFIAGDFLANEVAGFTALITAGLLTSSGPGEYSVAQGLITKLHEAWQQESTSINQLPARTLIVPASDPSATAFISGIVGKRIAAVSGDFCARNNTLYNATIELSNGTRLVWANGAAMRLA